MALYDPSNLMILGFLDYSSQHSPARVAIWLLQSKKKRKQKQAKQNHFQALDIALEIVSEQGKQKNHHIAYLLLY